VEFLREKLRENPKTGVLCFDEYAGELHGKNVFVFGKKRDGAAHAKKLFDLLRRFDDTDAPAIYALADDTDGIGLALYNRMLKASGYHVLDL